MAALTLKNLVKKALGRPAYIAPEEAAYRRLAAKGFRPAGIIDIGAYEGNWTRLARRVFPDVPCLMVEAQAAKRAFLEGVTQDLDDTSFSISLLSATSGEQVTFYEMETGSSILPEQSNAPRTETLLSTRTLDDVASEIKGLLFTKIDVQGAEMKVLAGGEKTLARSEVVQLEVAIMPYNAGAPTFLEMISYMDVRGLIPLDISGLTRPNGLDLVQVDILFAKRDSPLRPTFINF